MVHRRDALKLGAVAIAGTGLLPGSTGAQDDETPTETPDETPTNGDETPADGAEVTLTGDLLAATRMSGDQQPDPVETGASGSAVFTMEDDGNVGYELYAANAENVTMAHIHMAPEGEEGDVVQWLYPSADATEPEPIDETFDGLLARDVITGENLVGPLEGESLDRLIEEMQAGNTYVNVHTEENPAGEIRGQIVVVEGAETPEGTPTETPEGTPTETPEGTPTPTPEE